MSQWYKENPHVNMEGGTIVELIPVCSDGEIRDPEKCKYWGKGNVKNPFNPNAPIVLSGQMKVKSLEEAIKTFDDWIKEKAIEWVDEKKREQVRKKLDIPNQSKIIRL